MNRIYLYGIAEVADSYKIIRYDYIDSENEPITIKSIILNAHWMKHQYPSIEHVYAIDSSKQLARIYKDTIRAKSLQENVEFKILLEREGLFII